MSDSTVGDVRSEMVEVGDGRTTQVTRRAPATAPVVTLVEQDGAGATEIGRLYGWDVNDDSYDDLVLNTSTFTFEHVAGLIADIHRSKYSASAPPTSPTSSS
ncbi:hypothetical protein [Aestuariimicrobium ganziense]|uniref:hypothetical protein n=1 Tax=Aestuariimicrobium ganziense TaxID=2773677 RepID=UPI001941C3CD|nr:hypothetical protein [Aestuariimicrobium ganziense]